MKKEEGASVHWSRQKEKTAGYWHLKLVLILFRLLPVVILRIFAFSVGFFYFVFSKSARDASKNFMAKAANFTDDPKMAKKCRSACAPLQHIISFALTLIEKIQTWGNKFPFKNLYFQDDAVGDLVKNLEDGKGALIITSHLGNTELLRGLASFNKTGVSRQIPVTIIVDMKITKDFSRMLKEINPEFSLDIINVQDIGPQTSILLEEKIAAGGIVSIAGDRTSAGNFGKNMNIPFLGEEAPFSPGIFHLVAFMQASQAPVQVPIYFMFALRRKDLSLNPKYDMYVHKSNISFYNSSRKERFMRSTELAVSFAAHLEAYCKKYPFQWYNFYNFWAKEVQE